MLATTSECGNKNGCRSMYQLDETCGSVTSAVLAVVLDNTAKNFDTLRIFGRICEYGTPKRGYHRKQWVISSARHDSEKATGGLWEHTPGPPWSYSNYLDINIGFESMCIYDTSIRDFP
jgi:hypothetical protein